MTLGELIISEAEVENKELITYSECRSHSIEINDPQSVIFRLGR